VKDPRAPERVVHRLAEIIRFRMLMIAAGYEDGNDADSLRADAMFKLALDRLPSDGGIVLAIDDLAAGKPARQAGAVAPWGGR
jgi:Transposase DDE domain group 1